MTEVQAIPDVRSPQTTALIVLMWRTPAATKKGPGVLCVSAE